MSSKDAGLQRAFAKRAKKAGLTTEKAEGDALIVYAPDGRKLGTFKPNNRGSVREAEKVLAAQGFVIP